MTITTIQKIKVYADKTKLEPGKYYDIDETWTVVDGSNTGTKTEYIIYTETDDLLCHYIPQAISADLCDLAIKCYLGAGKQVSTNRGVAAGAVHRDINSKYEKGTSANSNILGYIDSPNHKKPCRLTMYSKKYLEKYKEGLPFIYAINELFKKTVPDKYEKQLAAAQIAEKHYIEGTCFSTVTVNYNFRTALHRDSGDFVNGFGNLVVCKGNESSDGNNDCCNNERRKGCKGGYLLFPRYKVAINMENGDYLSMNVHEYHCNSPIFCDGDAFRLSFVCYLREKMVKCSEINSNLEKLQINGEKAWDTSIIFEKIFKAIGENVPEKVKINNANTKWWTMTAGRFKLIYRNKRYELHDSTANVVVHNLMPSWNYANTLDKI